MSVIPLAKYSQCPLRWLPKKSSIDDPTQWVAGTFRRLLGREATKDELRAFVTAFHEDACRPETILYAILSHAEYQTY